MKTQSKRDYLRQLVTEKNRWTRPLTAEERAFGFLGWHERGYLPHCDFPGLVQLVTIRLADSMPTTRRGEWEHLLTIENVREKRTRLEDYLDRGLGECHLRDEKIAQLTEDALLYFHGDRYDLLAWCVMPNHVHVLVHIWQAPLGTIIKSWKKFVATKAQPILLERRPPARPEGATFRAPPDWRPALRAQLLQWEREFWDTFMRDEEHEGRSIRYIENNPVKARLCRVPKEWQFSSARFRDEYGKLVLQARS
jgi:REP element-mobilizing transposase RayT